MSDSERSFFAYKTDRGYVLSLAEKRGRKNYSLAKTLSEKPQSATHALTEKAETAPLAIESFALNPEHYHSLMERIEQMHQHLNSERTD